MKLFRLHITRTYGFLLLLIGIGLNISSISEQKVHHAAFTSWLGSHLKNDDSEAHKKLNTLSTDHSELEEVIRKASEVVTSHVDDFKLPVGSDENEPNADQVFHLLLSQWNQFQHTEAGMGKAVLIESVKVQTILPNDGKFVTADFSDQRKSVQESNLNIELNSDEIRSSSFLLSPLESGTAIGAP